VNEIDGEFVNIQCFERHSLALGWREDLGIG